MTVLEFIEVIDESQEPRIEIYTKEFNGKLLDDKINEVLYEGWYKETPYNLLNKKIYHIRSFQGNYGICVYPSEWGVIFFMQKIDKPKNFWYNKEKIRRLVNGYFRIRFKF